MKAFYRTVGVAVAAFIMTAPDASAQLAPAVIHGDAAATIGWLVANSPSRGQFDTNHWVNSLFGAFWRMMMFTERYLP